MPTPSQKAMTVAAEVAFHARVKLALVKVALTAIDDENSARAAFAKRVLRGEVNLPMVATAIVANPSIGAAIAAAEDDDDSYGVPDDDIAFAVAEGGDPATGVFHKLALANAS